VSFLFVQYGLRGWSNFKDDKGVDIPFKPVKRTHGSKSYTVADPELVKLIPAVVITELASEIRKANELDPTEEKN
jgi:hypothetical protein